MSTTRSAPQWMTAPRAVFTIGGLLAFVAACTSGAQYGTIFGGVERPPGIPQEEISAYDAHKALFEEENFPSARACAVCHPDHYREWSASPHAYAQMSPVFNAMHSSIVKLLNGTFGDFCIRCHSQVGMQKLEPVFESNLYRHPASREGISCIVCHRAPGDFGKVSGRFQVVKGDVYDPVFGPTGNDVLAEVLADDAAGAQQLATEPTADTLPENAIHGEISDGFFLRGSGFCGVCHDVNLGNGFRLEEAFSEYKSSPAAKRGVSCQDCHMVYDPEKPGEYAEGPVAYIGNQPIKQRRRRTNHFFAGPDYSIVHPGIFPHMNKSDMGFANLGEWLEFDHEAGWGTEEFEGSTDAASASFPERWQDESERRTARDLLNKQEALLEDYRQQQLLILRAGYKMGDELDFLKKDREGIKFSVDVFNGQDGHNVPTGFIAERTLFLEVSVWDENGKLVFVSGDTDPNGDLRDLHSIYVHNGELPLDEYLFSLQSKFIVRMVRGPEREQVLAINHSIDSLPFLRPSPFSVTIHGRPRGARIHRVSIAPNAHRFPEYEVKADQMTGPGQYTVRVRMIAGMVPPNLIDQIQTVGFDYGLSAREIGRRVVEGRQVLYNKRFVVDID